MKKIKYVPFISAVLLLVSAVKPVLPTQVKIIYQSPTVVKTMSPYEKAVDLTFRYSASEDKYEEIIRLYDINFNRLFQTNGTNRSFNPVYSYVSFSVTLPFDLYFDENGIRVNIMIRNVNTGNSVVEVSRLLLPCSEDNVISTQYKDENLFYDFSALDFTENNFSYENYNFSNTEGIISNNSFSKLLLSNISFIYQAAEVFKCEEAYLEVYDILNVFPNIEKVDNKFIVPLKINKFKSNYIVKFGFKNVMYVDPNSLDMSLTYKNGFVETNYFYLPKDAYNKLEDYHFEIKLFGCGYNRISITIPLTFVKSVTLLDSCFTSDFCVIGGIAE